MTNEMRARADKNWPEEKEIKFENGIHYFTRKDGKKSYRYCCEFATILTGEGKKDVRRCLYSSPDFEKFMAHTCIFETRIPAGFKIPKSYQLRVKSFGIIQAAAIVSAKLNSIATGIKTAAMR